MQTSSDKGFTLIELLVGMIISTIILGVAFMMFENASKSYSEDKVRVDAGQGLTAILDLIGTDIKQAGEQVSNAKFPAIKITEDSSGNRQITIRKALTDAFTLCEQVGVPGSTTPSSSPSSLFTGTSETEVQIGGCTGASSSLLTNLSDWQTERTGKTKEVADSEGITDRSTLTGNEFVGRVALVKANGQTHTVDYTGENLASPVKLKLQNINSTDHNVAALEDYANNNDSLYLIEERTYRYDKASEKLTLQVNGKDPAELVRDLKSFNITASVAPASGSPVIEPNPATSAPKSFPNATNDNWKRIVGVKVDLQVKEPSSCGGSTTIQGCNPEDFKTSGTFYPRNVMSK